jgi:nitrogen fixation NifU-like protein
MEDEKHEKRFGPYTAEVISHFRNPRNMGEMKDADAIAKVGSPMCGDELWIYLKIEKNADEKLYIGDISFQSFGCAASVATGSMLTEIAKGKTLEEALAIKPMDVLKGLGKLPRVKTHCSLLSTDALHEAIYQYYKKEGIEVSDELEQLHVKIKEGNVKARQKQETGIDYCEDEDEEKMIDERTQKALDEEKEKKSS